MVASDTPLRTDHSWLEMPALLDAAQICGNVFSAGVAAIYHLGLSFHACKENCSYAKARTAMTLAFRGDLLFAGDAVAHDSRFAGGTDSAENAAFQLPDAGAKMNIKRSRRKRNA